jgi:hypothetical protein
VPGRCSRCGPRSLQRSGVLEFMIFGRTSHAYQAAPNTSVQTMTTMTNHFGLAVANHSPLFVRQMSTIAQPGNTKKKMGMSTRHVADSRPNIRKGQSCSPEIAPFGLPHLVAYHH